MKNWKNRIKWERAMGSFPPPPFVLFVGNFGENFIRKTLKKPLGSQMPPPPLYSTGTPFSEMSDLPPRKIDPVIQSENYYIRVNEALT